MIMLHDMVQLEGFFDLLNIPFEFDHFGPLGKINSDSFMCCQEATGKAFFGRKGLACFHRCTNSHTHAYIL